jgi:hypothetical protein
LYGFLVVEPRSVRIALADGHHDWARHAVPLLNYTLAYALQLRKITETLSQSSRTIRRADFGGLLEDSPGFLSRGKQITADRL